METEIERHLWVEEISGNTPIFVSSTETHAKACNVIFTSCVTIKNVWNLEGSNQCF